MLNLFKKINKVIKKDTREWYTAEMLTAKGEPYKRGARARNAVEAAGQIALNMPDGSVIKRVYKGDL